MFQQPQQTKMPWVMIETWGPHQNGGKERPQGAALGHHPGSPPTMEASACTEEQLLFILAKPWYTGRHSSRPEESGGHPKAGDVREEKPNVLQQTKLDVSSFLRKPQRKGRMGRCGSKFPRAAQQLVRQNRDCAHTWFTQPRLSIASKRFAFAPQASPQEYLLNE